MDFHKDLKCRLCLISGISLVNVLNFKQLPSRIKECLNIEIKAQDTFPKTVCSTCLEKVESWHFFRDLCFKSQEMLKWQEKNMMAKNESSSITDETGNVYKVKEVIKIEIEDGSKVIKSDLIFKVPGEPEFEIKDVDQEEIDFENVIEIKPLSSMCDICLVEFADDQELLDHCCQQKNIKKLKRKANLTYCCKYCAKVFKSKTDLKEHAKVHRVVKCKVCNQEMLKTSIKGHMISHTDRFKCPHCSHQFGNNGNLQQHIINIHSDIKNYVCDICAKRFSSSANLNVHMQSHKESRDYECNICDYKGRTRSAVYAHMFIHDEEMLSCAFCGKLFKGSRKVTEHIKRVHIEAERKFKCSQCPKSFLSTYKRQQHEVIHSENRPHSCEICQKTFKRKDTLKGHMSVHILGNTVDCPECNKTYSTKIAFERHKCKGKEVLSEVESESMVV